MQKRSTTQIIAKTRKRGHDERAPDSVYVLFTIVFVACASESAIALAQVTHTHITEITLLWASTPRF